MMKTRRMRWAGYVARMANSTGAAVFWWGYLREREDLEGLCLGVRAIIRLILKKRDGGMDWNDLAQGWAGSFE